MKPTDEQAEIRDTSRTLKPGEILKNIAFAGSGKTSTLKLIAQAKRERGAYLVFGALNAKEAQQKLALTNCTATSMHALALGTMRHYMGKLADHNARTVRESGVLGRFTIPKVEGWNDFRVASAVIRTVSAFSNSADQEFTLAHAQEALISSVGDPDFIKDRTRRQVAKDTLERLSGPLMQMAEAFWLTAAEDGAYSHDMYLKAVDLDPNLRQQVFSMFRYLMVDECQDLNPVQRSIIQKTGLPIIAVGDPYQQIFSWRGAENALALMPGKELYLTQSFRFGENIAETARKILSMRPGGGPERKLIGLGNGDISRHDGAKVAFICRTNAGVIEHAIDLVKKGKKIYVSNLGELIEDVRSANALHVGDLRNVKSKALKHLNSWDELAAEAEEGDGNLSRLMGIIESGIAGQIEGLGSKAASDPAQAEVMLSTAHRSKGLEWPAVILGNDWKDARGMFGRYKEASRQSEKHKTLAIEEYNALYVAATRPMLRLAGHDRIINPPEPEYDDLGAGDWVPDYEPNYQPHSVTREDALSEVRKMRREVDDGYDHIV